MAISTQPGVGEANVIPLTRANVRLNDGGISIYSRAATGRYHARQITSLGIIYCVYFALPYLTWNGRQAVLFDIPSRKFYFFGSVIWPQDFWLLAMFLLFCFVLLFAMTAVRGRIFCGFMCPQTAWSSALAAIERFIEGNPAQRMRLDALPHWNPRRLRIKAAKHFAWLSVCTFTAVTFIGYFSGIENAWREFFTLNLNTYEWVTLITVVAVFYINSGIMREQVCMWICPYARIQGVFTDIYTRMTSYDPARGEPRGKPKRGARALGDCVDCRLCVAVCPTGVDIREGQQLGCINCGVCIDACDTVMERIGRPPGLIRFASKVELDQQATGQQRTLRVGPAIYSGVASAVFITIIIGLLGKSDVGMNVRHERDPMYTVMSDGTIQNSYDVSFLNKSEHDDVFGFSIEGLDGAHSSLEETPIDVPSGQVRHMTITLRAPNGSPADDRHDVRFVLRSRSRPAAVSHYDTVFISPPP